MRRVLPLLLALVVAGPALAQDPVRVGELAIEGAWIRATAGAARTGAAYLTVHNHGVAADRLVAAASPVAAGAELHTHLVEGGVMRMRPVGAIEVAPGEPAVLRPGGLHVMLIDLKRPLADGTRVPLTLTFARAGAVTLDVPVRRAAPPETGHDGHGHGRPGL